MRLPRQTMGSGAPKLSAHSRDWWLSAGYGGWVAIEEDHPRRDIVAVVRDNREYLRSLGY